ncbi:hypothetical protein [Agrococcus lahaulensis]|uniref:hypothetical protein n=1 Tax=Agrococcus lahaulensis TaxID=341722 RepID=UPI00047E91F0|nr:hypothetical protein [Agrococcus lahaulensis]
MRELLSELGSTGVSIAVQIVMAVVVGMLLAQVLGLIAWSIVRASRSARPQRPAERDPRPPAG